MVFGCHVVNMHGENYICYKTRAAPLNVVFICLNSPFTLPRGVKYWRSCCYCSIWTSYCTCVPNIMELNILQKTQTNPLRSSHKCFTTSAFWPQSSISFRRLFKWIKCHGCFIIDALAALRPCTYGMWGQRVPLIQPEPLLNATAVGLREQHTPERCRQDS